MPRDENGRFDDLLSVEDVEDVVTSGGLRYPAFRLVRRHETPKPAEYTRDVPWRPVPFTGSADVERVVAEFERGATIVLQGLHHRRPALAAFCRSLERALGHPAQANAYYTPAAAQGLPVHHDTHDVFSLQVAGEKRWRVYAPVLELPLRNQRYRPELGGPGEPVLDVTLRPGDTLYLPRGWLHEAMTSDANSLHLTIGVNVYTWLDAFRAAVEACADDVAFRRSVDDGVADALVARLVARLGRDDVRRRKREKIARARRPILDGQLAQLRALADLDLETELERRPTMISDVEDVDGSVTLLFDGKSLTFPGRVREQVEYVARVEERFRADDLPGALDDSGRLVLVRRLVREGFLRVSDA